MNNKGKTIIPLLYIKVIYTENTNLYYANPQALYVGFYYKEEKDMKDCNIKAVKRKVVGTLDIDNDNNYYIRVDIKDEEPQIVDVNEILESIAGHQICIQTEMDEV